MFAVCLVLIDDAGSTAKFERIFNTYGKQMLYVANSVLNNRQDAEDAVQDALIRIASHIDDIDLDNTARVRGYVLTAAKNAAKDLLRQKSARAATVDLDSVTVLADGDIDNSGYEEILDCIRSMEPLYRDVLYYRFVEEMSEKDIADLLGRKYGTVKAQISRGRAILIKCIKEKEEKNND